MVNSTNNTTNLSKSSPINTSQSSKALQSGRIYSSNSTELPSTSKSHNFAIAFFKNVFYNIKGFLQNKSVTVTVRKEDFGEGKSVKVRLPYPRSLKLGISDVSSKEAGGKKLREILASPFGLSALNKAAVDDHMGENLHFLHTLKHLSSLIADNNESEAKYTINQLKSLFLEKGSPLWVNIPEDTVKKFLAVSDYPFSSDFKNQLGELQLHIEEMVGKQQQTIDKAKKYLAEMENQAKESQAHLNEVLKDILP